MSCRRRRWESNPLGAALQTAITPCDISVVDRVSLPGVEPGLRPSQSRVPPSHPKDQSVPRRGLEPRPTASKAVVHPSHPQGMPFNIPTWIRTRAWTFGGSNAIRYTIGTDSRADDWIRTSMIRFTRPALFSVSHVGNEHEREDSNPMRQFWRLPALPGASLV